MSFGRQDITQVIEAIKKANDGQCDGTKDQQRKFGKLLIDSRAKKIYREYDPVEIIKAMIVKGKETYRGPSITSPMYLFYNFTAIINEIKEVEKKRQKKEPKKVGDINMDKVLEEERLLQIEDARYRKMSQDAANKFNVK